ncbi:MAG: transaldolase [Gammaproteobacteria bacterium]|nr:transaldolase [Gammaproteobacteria bacterium]
MSKSKLSQLHSFGQSFWYDNIQRSMLENGELQAMINNDDLRGITSNPSIFEKAITGSSDYDASLSNYIKNAESPNGRDAFFALAIEDIQAAADLLRPVYEKSDFVDGYVSLEVSPDIANDTEASINEAHELFLKINRPNVMIKIPATKAGVPAIEQLIADGININATLLFSVERYVEVAKAYIAGIAKRKSRGLPVNNVSSVASFFISRVDSNVDEKLDKVGREAAHLKGQLGIANAKLAYQKYQSLFSENAFNHLASAGAKPQRLLWASTGVKSTAYSDVLYIEKLIGNNTVNTIPPATAAAFNDHGKAEATLEDGIQNADAIVSEISKLGVNLDSIMNTLEVDGVDIFKKSFFNLLASIDKKIAIFSSPGSSNVA